MRHPLIHEVDWIEPSILVGAVGSACFSIGFVAGGDHPLANWSYICGPPVQLVRKHRVASGGEDPFAGFSDQLHQAGVVLKAGGPPFQGGWAGLASYEFGHAVELFKRPTPSDRATIDQACPDLLVGLIDHLIAFDHGTRRAFLVATGLAPDNLRPCDHVAEEQINGLRRAVEQCRANRRTNGVPNPPVNLVSTRSYGALLRCVERCVRYVRGGDIFQANISLRLAGDASATLDPLTTFRDLVTRHPSPYAAYLATPELNVITHSPECFVRVAADGAVETRPIKGTARRGRDQATDARMAQSLRGSEKDRAENLMIVDLMRNDLSRVCEAGSVDVPQLFSLETFSTVHHLVSVVRGKLKADKTAFDVLLACFPPGSITGAPKVRAMEIISELEQEARGPWCGSMFWVGWDGAGDSSVMIRSAVFTKTEANRWHIDVRGGGGIVADSDPASEVAEMHLKTKAIVKVLAYPDPVQS